MNTQSDVVHCRRVVPDDAVDPHDESNLGVEGLDSVFFTASLMAAKDQE